MSKCPRCKIDIKDPTVKCPLCRSVLVPDAEQTKEPVRMYPEPGPALKALRFATKITIFSAIVVELVAILVNYLTYTGFKWSMLVGGGLIYGCFSLIYSVRRNKSHQRKIVMQLVIGLLLILYVDFAIGFQGWSLSYGFSGAIVFVDIGMLVLMIVDFKNYQNYLYPMIWIVVISAICLLLAIFIPRIIYGEYTFPFWNIIASAVSALFLAGIIVFGDTKSKNELKRRFHV